ncbi:hypothetical protein EDD15DRAFT_2197055 [Pisolithus albus]|nr:hypothetical protein EDD15DRAFT_2197055 [Pisolithus albus]
MIHWGSECWRCMARMNPKEPNLTVYVPVAPYDGQQPITSKGRVVGDGGGRNIKPYQAENKRIPVTGVLLEGEQTSTRNQDVTFWRPASPNEGCVASGVKGKKAGGNGEPTDGEDDTANSGNGDSQRVEAALLAGSHQDMRRNQNLQGGLPMSLRPFMRLRKHPYEAIRPRRQQERITFEARNVGRSCDNTVSHAREGTGTSLKLTIKPMTLEECPEGIRSRHSVNTNVPSRIGGQEGQDEVKKAFGVAEGK